MDPEDDTNYKEWKDKISARFINNKDRPFFTVLKLFIKTFSTNNFIISVNLPWLLTKVILKYLWQALSGRKS